MIDKEEKQKFQGKKPLQTQLLMLKNPPKIHVQEPTV